MTSAALASPTLPFTFNFNQQEMRIDNRTYSEGQRAEIIENVSISTGYLGTLGVRFVDGRDVDASDITGSPDVAVINQTMARKFWPNESAVGHTFQTINPTRSRTYRVIGVVADHKRHGVLEQPSPFVYYAEAQRPSRYNFLLARTNGDAASLVGAMRRELLAMEPSLVFMASNTMEGNLGLSLMPGSRRRAAGLRVRRPRDAAGRHWSLRCDRVFAGAPHARHARADGAGSQASWR